MSASSHPVSWLPHFHDMGLVYGLLLPLYVGCSATLFSYASFVQKPLRWLDAISRYRATHSGGPNAAYELCLKRIAPDERTRLDLSSWRVAFNGAEPLRAATLEQFGEEFAASGFKQSAFYPVYGLAEATLKVTSPQAGEGYRVAQVGRDGWRGGKAVVGRGDEQQLPVVGCGAATGEHAVRVVNPETLTPCRAGQVGEIWVRGPSVAVGYWGKPEETTATFGARLAGGEGPYLRTGDLGFTDGSELFIAGRLKDCIIIRGQNHYPQDIEETARRAHASLRHARVAAFAVATEAGESFAVVAEAPKGIDPAQLIEPIRRAVGSEHQLQPSRVVIVPPNALPLTSSGQLRRAACRAALAAGQFDVLAEGSAQLNDYAGYEAEAGCDGAPARDLEVSDLEAEVAEAAARVLGCSRAAVAAEQNLTELGLDSLRAAELANALHASCGASVGLLDVLECQSVHQLAALVASAPRSETPAAASPQSEFPISGGQAGLWFLSQLTPESSAYQIARALRLDGAVDLGALDAAFVEVVRRHPALRTSFHERDGAVVQRVESAPDNVVQFLDATAWDEATLRARLEDAARTPFDLRRAPLVRAQFYAQGAGGVLLLAAHHLVCDLWSLDLMLEELSEFYADGAGRRATPGRTFADFVRAESEALARADASWDYWAEALAGELPTLQLENRARRPASSQRPAGHVRFTVAGDTTAALKRLASAHDGTLHTTLLAIFQSLLHRYTTQAEVIVGTPTLGRHRPEFAGVVGCFVNTLPIRTRFDDGPSFLELHARVRRDVRAAMRHSVVPFPAIVERLAIKRERGVTPVYQAMFTFQRQRAVAAEGVAQLALAAEGGSLRLGPLEAETLALTQGATQFDITLTVAEVAGELWGTLEYDAHLFDARAMTAFAGHFRNFVAEVVTRGDRPVADYDFLTEDERAQQLDAWNNTEREYPGPDTLHALFEAQVSRTPSRPALLFDGGELSYRQLNERADALAAMLAREGVRRGDVVAVCLDRSPELVCALLGILKAGGAYLPLDTAGPAQRLENMLAKAGASLAVGSSRTEPLLTQAGVRVVLAEAAVGQPATRAGQTPCTPDDLAYVIFTSGSTGRPKGVAVAHRGIANRLKWMQEHYSLGADDVVLQKTPATFDVSVWEFFWPLLYGASLAIAQPGGHRDPAYLAEAVRRYGVTTIHFVPSMLRAFLDETASSDCPSLRRVICSGEALPPELERKHFETLTAELHNLYGPTEASVDVTAWKCDGRAETSVPIGVPIANMRTYVLDEGDQLLPAGRTGLLHLAGVGLARGYINDPALTAERFVPDPYSRPGGARMYRTGDLACYRADGAIEFRGRCDQQVKIRGFRVELDEIAHALAQHPSVAACAVDLQGAAHDPQLVAFFVPTAAPDTAALRAHLKQSLPDYMIPVAFVALDSLPLSANGKLDRKALPSVGRERLCTNEYAAPRTPVEESLAAIWAELPEVPHVGVHH